MKQRKLWKRSACFKKYSHNLSESELVLFIVDQVEGTAKDALDILDIDFMGSRGLEKVWQILDQAHAKTGVAYEKLGSAPRRHGQSMKDWIVCLRRASFDLEAVDKHAEHL